MRLLYDPAGIWQKNLGRQKNEEGRGEIGDEARLSRGVTQISADEAKAVEFCQTQLRAVISNERSNNYGTHAPKY